MKKRMIRFLLRYISKLKLENKALKEQLDIVVNDDRVKRYKPNNIQRTKLVIVFHKLGYPEDLAYIFKIGTLKQWFRNFVKRPIQSTMSKSKRGRPRVSQSIRALIRWLKLTNKSWGCRRIAGILKQLGIQISFKSVFNILYKYPIEPYVPTGAWKKFISSRIDKVIQLDLKKVMVNGSHLYVLFFLAVKTKKILHYNVTEYPNTQWFEQQLREISDGSQKIYLIRDDDIVFKHVNFAMFDNIKDIPIVIARPNMNAYVERFIRSFNEKALSHFPVINDIEQLRYITREYVQHFNYHRPHQGIDNNTPCGPEIVPVIKNTDDISHLSMKRISHLGGRLNSYCFAKYA